MWNLGSVFFETFLRKDRIVLVKGFTINNSRGNCSFNGRLDFQGDECEPLVFGLSRIPQIFFFAELYGLAIAAVPPPVKNNKRLENMAKTRVFYFDLVEILSGMSTQMRDLPSLISLIQKELVLVALRCCAKKG